MVLEIPLWSTGPEGSEFEHSAQLDRRLVQATFRADGGVFRHVNDTALRVRERAAGPNMTVDVDAGMCVVPGTTIPHQGSYICRSTAVENVPVASAPGSGTRTDLVVARVYDSEASGSQDKFDIEVLTGTTNLPDNAIGLARLSVASGTPSISSSAITDIRDDASLAQVVPTGSMTMTATSTAPNGWLLCNGAAVSRSTFAQLFAAIGTLYGSGNGSTTFNVPDMRTRFPVGVGSGHSLSATGGAQAVTLAVSQMPNHAHGRGSLSTGSGNLSLSNAGNHNHGHDGFAHEGGAGSIGWGSVASTMSKNRASRNSMSNGSHSHGGTSHTHTIGGSTGGQGGGNSHENRPPYLAVNFIIKI